MSVKLMSRIWDEGPSTQAERFVLLAIADNASDSGLAYPSVASLARKTCMTERGIQKILRRLEAGGWLFTDAREGRKNCNLYTIFAAKKGMPDPEHGSLNPEHGSPQRGSLDPEHGSLDPERGSLDPEHGSPEPSLTIINHHTPSKRGSLVLSHDQEENRTPAGKSVEVGEIYSLYPRKVARGAAEKAIANALKTTTAQTLIEAVTAYASAVALWSAEDQKYIPHPATWFNARRWEDDRATWERKPQISLTAPLRQVHYKIS